MAQRILDQVVEQALDILPGAGETAARARRDHRRAVCHASPAFDRRIQEVVRRDRASLWGMSAVEAREREQARGQHLAALELLEHDLPRLQQLLHRRHIAVAPKQLELAARDRERRQQLVRCVVEEGAAALDDELPLADMPHHDEEDQRHERDLGKLGLALGAHLDRTQGEHEDRRHHGEQGEHAVEGVFHMRRP